MDPRCVKASAAELGQADVIDWDDFHRGAPVRTEEFAVDVVGEGSEVFDAPQHVRGLLERSRMQGSAERGRLARRNSVRWLSSPGQVSWTLCRYQHNVYLICAILRYAFRKCWAPVSRDLRQVYTAARRVGRRTGGLRRRRGEQALQPFTI